MAVYQGKLIGADGRVLRQSAFEAEDDAAAIEYARRNVMNKPIEIWRGERCFERVEPKDRFKADLASFFGNKN